MHSCPPPAACGRFTALRGMSAARWAAERGPGQAGCCPAAAAARPPAAWFCWRGLSCLGCLLVSDCCQPCRCALQVHGV